METRDILLDAFGRVHEEVGRVLHQAKGENLILRPDPDANSIGWLVWHLTRVMDDHVSEIAGLEQTWTANAWEARFDLPFAAADTGYGHTSEQVGEVRATADSLAGYHDAVHTMAVAYLTGIDAAELDRVIDTGWDPPVTVGVRLVSVISDTLQHVGQAAYVLGMAERRHPGPSDW